MACAAGAQELKRISNEEALSHLSKRVEPDFPPMAEGAGIYGIVTLEITITGSGYVTNPKGVAGDPILVQAALNAIRQWEFKPFMVKRQPVWVRATIQVDFSPGSVAVLRKKYRELESECATGLMANKFAEVEPSCEQGLATAIRLPQRFAMEKMRAYGYAGQAAYNSRKVDVALKDFKQELIFTRQAGIRPFSAYMIVVHGNLAHAYADTGKLREADVQYIAAEKSQENSLDYVESRREGFSPYMYEGLKAEYGHKLRILLEDHAKVLRRMGKTKEANILERRAAALPESSKV